MLGKSIHLSFHDLELCCFSQNVTFTKRWAFLYIKTWTHTFGVVFTQVSGSKVVPSTGPFALRNKNRCGDPKRDCFDLRRHLLLLFWGVGDYAAGKSSDVVR